MASLRERRPQSGKSRSTCRDERSLEPKQRRGDDFEKGAGVVQLSEIENAEPCVWLAARFGAASRNRAHAFGDCPGMLK
jgi:hypothetical protein